MSEQMPCEFDVQVYNSVADVGIAAWDALSAGRPFQSARWYQYGERVMADCQPLYVILSRGGQAVARGTFWVVRNEPLPVPARMRTLLHSILRHWPLLICRSPLSNSSGLVLPDPPMREPTLKVIAEKAFQELRHLRGSFLVFDYLYPDQAEWAGWPSQVRQMQIADPGTRLALQWDNFESYLEGNKKYRIHQHFKRSSRDAAGLGIRVTRHHSFSGLPLISMELIRNVERRHQSASNPWALHMLENMEMAESTWLTAHIGERLVGCLLLLVDQGVQIATLPGLTEDVPFAYFMLLYEAIQEAIEKKLAALRWGSGAYETKRRLGFELENNNYVAFYATNPIFRTITRMMA